MKARILRKEHDFYLQVENGDLFRIESEPSEEDGKFERVSEWFELDEEQL